jgi:small-conductance mechanosensitive channel
MHARVSAGMLALGALFALFWSAALQGQTPPTSGKKEPPGKSVPPNGESPPAPANKVDVTPLASDEQIRLRLIKILKATDWYYDPEVSVEEGVVFLKGRTETEQHRKWAGELARNTVDVVAVVNQLEVIEPEILDFTPALNGMLDLWRGFVRSLPWIVFALIVIILSYFAAKFTRRGLEYFLENRWQNNLLRRVAAFAGGVFIFLAGLYFILRVAGLTQLAFTILGGTGIVGIILGIGFRDITENFLASILLSWQHPFRNGDLIEINNVTGYVERMNVRSTVIMTPSGNHVQIPNATVYKSTIRNFTSNPNRREDFVIGISYDAPITGAQDVALEVLNTHPAVLKNPEPSVLVDNLGPSTVNLRVYFWLNGIEHSFIKVKSSVIRLVKRAFLDHGITMPDQAREIVFPRAVPIRMLEADGEVKEKPKSKKKVEETTAASTEAEGGLSSESVDVIQQSTQARPPEEGEDLLKN